MVSIEAQTQAELLIQKVSSVEQSNSAFRRAKQVLFSESSQNPKEVYYQSIESRDVNLADDLSSQGSEEEEEECCTPEKPQAVEQSSLCAELWRQEFLVEPAAQNTEMDQCKLAMYQMLLNSDIKVRNLQYEVLALQRLYEDAKLTIERYQNKIESLEQRVAAGKQSLSVEDSSVPDPFKSADLRMEEHLNKLLSSRTKAMDENLMLKRQLLDCCPKCREMNPTKTSPRASELTENQPVKSAVSKKSKPPAPRPTFQKTAFALVQRMGKRDTSPTSQASSSSSDTTNIPKRSRTSTRERNEGDRGQAENCANGTDDTLQIRRRSASVAPHHQRMRSQSTPPLKKVALSDRTDDLKPLHGTAAVEGQSSFHSSGGFIRVTRPRRPASVADQT